MAKLVNEKKNPVLFHIRDKSGAKKVISLGSSADRELYEAKQLADGVAPPVVEVSKEDLDELKKLKAFQGLVEMRHIRIAA